MDDDLYSAKAAVFDMETGRLRVMEDKCSTCIFRPGNLMYLTPGRVAQMVEETRADPYGHITCHHTLPWADPRQEKGAVCRGWWDGYAREKFWARMAVAMKLIDWWKEP